MPSAYINLSLNANKFLQPQWPDSSHRNQISHVPSHQEKERTLQPWRLQGFLDRLTYFEEWGIGGTWLQPGIMPVDYKAAHKRVYALTKKRPDSIWGYTVLPPYWETSQYESFIKWTVEELGFKVLKLQPYAFCTSPLTPQSQKVFETAVKLNIPVIIHTGNGMPCALPSLAIPVAKAYPELNIVLAHSGAGIYGAEALIAAQQCPNITLEPSLTTVMDIPSFIRKLGAEPVMFGTDIPLNASAELGKYKALHLTEEPYAWVHEGTARRVFRL